MADDSSFLGKLETEVDDSGQVRDETTMEYVLRTFLRVEGDMERHPLPLALANDGIDDMATLVMLDKNHIAALRLSLIHI